MRARLERHAHSLLVVDSLGAEPDERTRTIYKHVRSGSLRDVRLLHLLKMDDNGAPSEPFKTLAGQADANTIFTRCIAKLIQIICMLRPRDAPDAMPFINALCEKILKYRGKGVSWPALGKYYSAILRRVCANPSSFHVGGGSRSGSSYDLQWLRSNNDEQMELEEALDAVRAEKATKRQSDRQPGSSPEAKKGAADKEKKKKERQEAAKARDAGTGDVVRAAGIAAGKAVSRPKKGDKEEWDKFKTEFGKGPPAKSPTADKKVPACFDFYHAQGCCHKDKCTFSHSAAP